MVNGSPAHAGIDLELREILRLASWFPRPRGDRPCKDGTLRLCLLVPPAHAGIDPTSLRLISLC